ncbi:MAG TPA: hypothetical protein PKZ76_01765 [Xanthomonadaceae bacterium]|nr:hypothetical protein [Xanthomonadaceae bacterium]
MPNLPSGAPNTGEFPVLSRTILRHPVPRQTEPEPASTPGLAVRASGPGAALVESVTAQWWFPLAFAGAFVVAGAAVAFIGWNFEPVVPNPYSRWVALAFGSMFAAGGLFMLLTFIPQLFGVRRAVAAEGWRSDHAWEQTTRRELGDDGPAGFFGWLRRALFIVVIGIFYGLFHLPLLWGSEYIRSSFSAFGAAVELSGEVPWLAVVIVFDVILLLVVAALLLRALQRMRFGRPALHLQTFPARIGGTFEAELHLPRGAHATGPARVRLISCAAGGEDATRDYEEALTYDTAGKQVHRLHMRFDLPADAPGTRLRDAPRVTWRLEISIATRGPDFSASFLVPVYGSAA